MSSYIIIRHAQSHHNKGTTQNLDSPLTDKGIKQAERLAIELGRYDLKGYALHVSPFLRTLMTAERIVANIPSLTAIVDPLLSEALAPHYSGVFVPRRQYDYPKFDWSHFVGAGFLQHREDGLEFFPRVESAFGRMPTKAIVVSHGMFCLAFGKKAAGTLRKNEDWDDSIGNASITHIEDGQVKKWGCALHLEKV